MDAFGVFSQLVQTLSPIEISHFRRCVPVLRHVAYALIPSAWLNAPETALLCSNRRAKERGIGLEGGREVRREGGKENKEGGS